MSERVWRECLEKVKAGEMTMLEAHKRTSYYPFLLAHPDIDKDKAEFIALTFPRELLPDVVFITEDRSDLYHLWNQYLGAVQAQKIGPHEAAMAYYDSIINSSEPAHVDEIPVKKLLATTDRNPRALLTKALYWWRNLMGRAPNGITTFGCRALGYCCEWVYPYGFVPEAGCPLHD
jgi:hypothetical protein